MIKCIGLAYTLSLIVVGALDQKHFIFDRPICSGLGDRMGTMMTLATLGRLHSAQIVFEWCNDTSRVYHRYKDFIPGFHGWNYNLTELKTRFSLPKELVIVERFSARQMSLPKVIWENVGVPAEQGSDAVYTVSWRTTSLNVGHVDQQRFKDTYKKVTKEVTNPFKINRKSHYIVLHMRGPDENTFGFPGAHDKLHVYCTGKILGKLLKLTSNIFVISNNVNWASEILNFIISNNVQWTSELLDGRITIVNNTSAYDDFQLLLGATGIVQHAYGGWSSYSTVPAMMAGIPLITTYNGQPQRLLLFKAQGGIPEELHTCKQSKKFVKRIKNGQSLIH